MTPEERFTKIENALHSLAETQARHEIEIEKQNSGIRDLVIVSRTLLDSQKETTGQIQSITGQIQDLLQAQTRTDAEIRELRDAQKHTDEKLNALIGTVDRIVKRIEIR